MSLLRWDCLKVAGEDLDSVSFVLHWVCIPFAFLKSFARNGSHTVDPRGGQIPGANTFYPMKCEKMHNLIFSLN